MSSKWWLTKILSKYNAKKNCEWLYNIGQFYKSNFQNTLNTSNKHWNLLLCKSLNIFSIFTCQWVPECPDLCCQAVDHWVVMEHKAAHMSQCGVDTESQQMSGSEINEELFAFITPLIKSSRDHGMGIWTAWWHADWRRTLMDST